MKTSEEVIKMIIDRGFVELYSGELADWVENDRAEQREACAARAKAYLYECELELEGDAVEEICLNAGVEE